MSNRRRLEAAEFTKIESHGRSRGMCVETIEQWAAMPARGGGVFYCHESANVDPECAGNGTIIGHECFIDSSAKIGDYVLIEDRCSVYAGVQIGRLSVLEKACIVREGAILYGYNALGKYAVVWRNAKLFPSAAAGMRASIGAGTTLLRIVHVGMNASTGPDQIIGANLPDDACLHREDRFQTPPNEICVFMASPPIIKGFRWTVGVRSPLTVHIGCTAHTYASWKRLRASMVRHYRLSRAEAADLKLAVEFMFSWLEKHKRDVFYCDEKKANRLLRKSVGDLNRGANLG